jgi:hypothetical protein
MSSSDNESPELKQIRKGIAEQYKQKLIKLAKQDTYTIPLNILENGVEIPDPFNPSKKYVIYREWEEKEFKRHKITVQDWHKAEELKAIYNSEDDDTETKTNLLMNLYSFLAKCYLKMSTKDDFVRASWGELRPIIDACDYRTEHSLADISDGIYKYWHLDVPVFLTHEEIEMVRTYRLWTGKAKTKPWEINAGGVKYQEDLSMVLKMEELENSGHNFKAKKAERSSGGGASGGVDADGTRHTKTTKIRER